MADHSCIDVLHENRGKLGGDGRKTQQNREPNLLSEGHRLTLSDHPEEYVFLSCDHKSWQRYLLNVI